ncbi:MAG: NAD-dependent epimerase/dehydratase family protein, partial [Nitrososphaerales archaeon]
MVSIAILGANGFIGRNSCRFFSDAGYSVVGLVRDSSKEEAVRVNGAQPRVVDYKSVDSLSNSFTG